MCIQACCLRLVTLCFLDQVRLALTTSNVGDRFLFREYLGPADLLLELLRDVHDGTSQGVSASPFGELGSAK